jgi:katanin p60 ATPase-containing subunit A1
MPMRKKLLKEGGFKNLGNISELQAQLDIPIEFSDFEEGLKNIQKSVSKEDLERYDKFMAEFGSS